VHDAVRAVTPYAAAHHVQLEQFLPDEAITRLDPASMPSVLTAMLENAIRFSPLDGRVVIRVSRDNERLCMTVTDEGDGIAPDILPRVFEGFVQTDLMHHSEGQGLSLALAYQIVLAHHGTITVVSTKGLGTTFTVSLPIHTSQD
jgi:two-component system sensor histidine kinase SenX3